MHPPPHRVNELWANPAPPMRPPPVLRSHKALHYHRAWRDGEALKSGVWRREGGRCGTEKGEEVGECRFIVVHHSEALGHAPQGPPGLSGQPTFGPEHITRRRSYSRVGGAGVLLCTHVLFFFKKELSPGWGSHIGAGFWIGSSWGRALLNVEAFQGLGVGWLREVYAAAERVFRPTAWPLAPGC